MGTNKEEIRAIVREVVKEIVVEILANLSSPKTEETEPGEMVQQPLIPPPPPPKPERITFLHEIKIKFVGRPERTFASKKDFVEEIMNKKFSPGRSYILHHSGKVKDHQHLIQFYRNRMEKLLADTGSILKIEYIKCTTTEGQEYEA